MFDLNFRVREGETAGRLGPNGACKTATTRALPGFMTPDKGSCSIGGMDCTAKAPQIQKGLGYVPGEITFIEGIRGGAVPCGVCHGDRGRRPSQPGSAGRPDLTSAEPDDDIGEHGDDDLFLFSCLFNSSALSLGLGAGIPILFLQMKVMGGVSTQTEFVGRMSIYGLYDPAELVRGASAAVAKLAYAALIFLLFFGGMAVFHKNRPSL